MNRLCFFNKQAGQLPYIIFVSEFLLHHTGNLYCLYEPTKEYRIIFLLQVSWHLSANYALVCPEIRAKPLLYMDFVLQCFTSLVYKINLCDSEAETVVLALLPHANLSRIQLSALRIYIHIVWEIPFTFLYAHSTLFSLSCHMIKCATFSLYLERTPIILY